MEEEKKTQSGIKSKRLPKWMRITMRVLLCVILFILLIPVLIYLPPVQTVLKDIACKEIFKATGMKAGIERLRLKFPLDVALDGVYILDTSGDTMVRARSLIADVKLRPLFALNIDVNKIDLQEGYYRMVSSDSSLIMKINAGHLAVDGGSSMNIAQSRLKINDALLENGTVSLYMNVWKKQNEPQDTTSTPFHIEANHLRLKNFGFAMSMLPTIDTLDFKTTDLELHKGVIDLDKNIVSLGSVKAFEGKAVYLTPTPQYVQAHPAPVDTTTSSNPTQPMTIKGDSISLKNFDVLYAMKGYKPQPGFDASYISLNGVSVGLTGFYNQGAELRLPVTMLEGRERCGLDILSGSGLIALTPDGMNFEGLKIKTLYSDLSADATISNAFMAMTPTGMMSVSADAQIGMADVLMFMPSLKPMLGGISMRYPLMLSVDADGSLRALNVKRLDVSMRKLAALRANGVVMNMMQPEKLSGRLAFDGSLENTSLLDKALAKSGVRIPPMRLRGNASAVGKSYSANFELLSRAGNVAANGRVNLNSESYNADVDVKNLDIHSFMPSQDIGYVSAHIKASGSGFNPERLSTHTNIAVDISRLQYLGREYGDMNAHISLNDGYAQIDAVSYDPMLDFDISGRGRISKDLYDVDLTARLNNIDLYAIGLSKEINSGSGTITLVGNASPQRWLYDMTLDLSNFDWNLPGQYIHLPGRTSAHLTSTRTSTDLNIAGNSINVAFAASSPLDSIVTRVPIVLKTAISQADKKDVNIEELQHSLPQFDLTLNASSRGLLRNVTEAAGIEIDTLYVGLHNRDRLYGFAGARSIKTSSISLDTAYMTLSQRNKLLDYKIHVGNRPGTLDEFARVDMRGYLGGNRLSAFLTQNNIQGETGYRLGFTAAFADSLVSLHFTPLQATIGYKPWEINEDNHLDYYWTRRIDANLVGQSGQSKILLETVPTDNPSDNALHVNLHKVYLQDFIQMSAFAPPITGEINSDLNIIYKGKAIIGNGAINVTDFCYDKKRVGTFDLSMKAGTNFKGAVGARFELNVDKKPVAVLAGAVRTDSVGNDYSVNMKLSTTALPLSMANPFLGEDVAKLEGNLTSNLTMTGTMLKPHLSGSVQFDNATAYIPMTATTLKLDSLPVTVDDNLLKFNNFNILAENKNPLSINGEINARNISNVLLDINADAQNIQLVGGKKRSSSQVYGPLYMNLAASAKGTLSRLDIKANASVLSATDVSYTLTTSAQQLAQQSTDNVVKFVNFNDTTAVAKSDTIGSPPMMLRVDAQLAIINGAKITVNLSDNASDKVQLNPNGTLTYTQNYMGDIRLNGRLTLGNGFARYSIPVVGEKMFSFNPDSYVLWQGTLMNPLLNISAVDELKANVKQNGNSRLVNFLVTLDVTNNLESPKISFNLSTNDDLSIKNELESMTAEQRSTQAMNLLLYNTYTGPDTKASANLAGNPLYSFLESQINSWASNHIRGVDLSFGIDQYDKTVDGKSSTTTSYSYQLSKSLFSNRFKISVGGNYSTDANVDENFAENLISDISFEYMLKQSASMNMLVRLFRHTGYESILEGEITETGVGFVMKRKLGNLRRLLRFGRRRRNLETVPREKLTILPDDTVAPPDTIIDEYDKM